MRFIDKILGPIRALIQACHSLWQKLIHRCLPQGVRSRYSPPKAQTLFRRRRALTHPTSTHAKVLPLPVETLKPIEHVANHLREQSFIIKALLLSHQMHAGLTETESAFLKYQTKSLIQAHHKLIRDVARQELRQKNRIDNHNLLNTPAQELACQKLKPN